MAESANLLGRVAVSQVSSTVNNNINNNNNNQQAEEEAGGICGCCIWYKKGPFFERSRLVFLGWIVFLILGPIFYVVYLAQADEDVMINYGYIFCCSLAILMSFYASCNFQDVMKLRDNVNKLVKSTKLLGVQRDKIRDEVTKLEAAHSKLTEIEDDLAENNKELREKFTKFEKWNATIQQTTSTNKEAASNIKKDFTAAIKQYKAMLEQNERAILDKAYQHVENRDGQKGLSEYEFEDLLDTLPPRYKQRFKRLGKSFKDFDEDGNGIIDYKEFKGFMDIMAKQEAIAGVNIKGITDKPIIIDDDDGKDDQKGN